MIGRKRSLPSEAIQLWPEVFGDIKLNAIPLNYVYSLLIKFKDGRTWEIKVTNKTKKNGWKSFEKSLQELCQTYEEFIVEVDCKIDTDRVKKDVERLTHKFLKRTKL